MVYSVPLLSEKIDLNHRIDDVVARLKPSTPLHILDLRKLNETSKEFVRLFRGTVMYAVKCNPTKEVIKTIAKAGVKTFDVASIEEVRLIRKWVPQAKIHFMHTVKSREAIREAYFDHGVRVFVLDSFDELHKIVHETNLAPDLELYIRLALPKNKAAAMDFSAKFGATPDIAVSLLREARLVSSRLGIMFHPGSQSKNADVFRKGIGISAEVIKKSGITVDAIDVGGGFPAPYQQQNIAPLSDYIATIHRAIDDYGLASLDLYCEPGRALVAESGKLIVRVELRKDNVLYLNDGVYGGLVEAASFQGGFIYPLRLIRKEGDVTYRGGDEDTLMSFRFCGPTCDSVDMMAGPFILPADIAEGDFIEVGITGAYSISCRTNFNGFGKHQTVIL
jgi:ornithine decarboxylase